MSTTVTIGSGKNKERKERIKERLKRGSMKKRINKIEKDQGKGQ